jgi:hypothetical protein
MPANLTSIEPVRKTVTVPAAPPRAFELFTRHIHEWWPLATHSVGAEQAAGVTFGGGPGGQIVETWRTAPRRSGGPSPTGSRRTVLASPGTPERPWPRPRASR